MKSKLLIYLLILFSSSCSKEQFFLRSDGADMPLLISGNVNSRVFILFLHGGPGASGFYDKFGDFFSGIENDFAMVYWEQPGSGLSQGNVNPASVNISGFINNIDKVITLIRNLYNNPVIFLMGHSWGGGLGTAYLVRNKNSNFNSIKGWIEVDGLHNAHASYQMARERIIKYANEKISLNDNSTYWSGAISFYNSLSLNSLLEYPNTNKHSDYVAESGGYWYGEKYNYANLNNIFFSPSSGFDFLSNNGFIHKKSLLTNLDNFTSPLSAITIPSLILWGRYDGIIPLPMAANAFDSLGTPIQDKHMLVFNHSAHSPYIEEKEIFNNKVIMFINQYK